MKTTRREMEAELQSLVPRAPSDRVRDRLALELGATQRTSSWRTWTTTMGLGLALAASLAGVVFWWPQSAETPPPLPTAARHVETPPPTMLAYQRALVKSPEDLDELLDRHAATLLTGSSPWQDAGALYRKMLPERGSERP